MNAKPLDPRQHAYRDDIAALELKGRVEAQSFVEGEPKEVRVPNAPLRRHPRADASLDTEVLFGEQVKQFDERQGWAWVQSCRDSYVGYVPSSALTKPGRPGTHSVCEPATFIYSGPDMKLPPMARLPMNANVRVKALCGDFAELDFAAVNQPPTPGFIFTNHLVKQPDPDRSYLDIARLFVGTPYLWGGCTYAGIDCSGLVQTALLAAGHDCLRDTHMQEETIGHAVDHDQGKGDLQPGDLIFWSGHVGIMTEDNRLLHANAYHMKTVLEPYPQARERIAQGYTGHVTSIRRL